MVVLSPSVWSPDYIPQLCFNPRNSQIELKIELKHFNLEQVIKTFSTREGWWYIGIKGDGGVKSKGTRLLIEK